jgi:hypothetical protein
MPRILCHGKPGQRRSASSPEARRRFADEQKLALDCGNRLRVFPKRLQIQATHELGDHVDAVEDISEGKCGFPKRQERPRARLWRQLAP